LIYVAVFEPKRSKHDKAVIIGYGFSVVIARIKGQIIERLSAVDVYGGVGAVECDRAVIVVKGAACGMRPVTAYI